MPSDLDRELAAKQIHCNVCAKKFTSVKYECPICGEWSCSDECRKKHIKDMNNI